MSNGTAQISEFTLTSNSGTAASETFGPFTLPDALRAYRFEISPTQAVNTLRLDVIASSADAVDESIFTDDGAIGS